MKILYDTSALRAALDPSHEFFHRAIPWLERAQSGDIDGVVSSHTLAEFYVAMSRRQPFIRTDRILAMISENILPFFEIVYLTDAEYIAALERLAEAGIRGASIYDALIAHAAVKANAERIVTFNESDFIRVSAGLPVRITAL